MLRLELTPSRSFFAAATGAHVAALAAVVPLEIPSAIKAGLAVLIFVSLGITLRRHAFLAAPGSVVCLEIRDSSAVAVLTRRGSRYDAHILGSTFVSPRLTVLNLKRLTRRGVLHVVLLPDGVDPEAYRRLRVLLRWGARHDETGNDAAKTPFSA